MGRRRKHPKHKPKKKWYQRENQWGNYIFDWSLGLGSETWREIFAILVLIISVVIFLGFFDFSGILGAKLSLIIHKFFGSFTSYILPFVTFWIGILLLFPSNKDQRISRFIGFFFLIVFLSTFLHLFIPFDEARDEAMSGNGGGNHRFYDFKSSS